jgi:hypothetical protein
VNVAAVVIAFARLLLTVTRALLSEWKLITVVPTATQIISRSTSRVFVGLPLCEFGIMSSRLCGI